MVDINGVELKVGQKVVYAYNSGRSSCGMAVGHIERMTPQTVQIQRVKSKYSNRCKNTSSQLLVLEE